MEPTKEQLLRAYDNAPAVVQQSLSDGSAIKFIGSLRTRYGLHVDTVGEVIKRIRNLLLGLTNPIEFLGELVSLGISDTVARTLIGDLNKEVFIPLREQMQKEPKDLGPVTNTPEPIVVPQKSLSAQTVLPAPALDYGQAPMLPGSPVPAPMPAIVPLLQEAGIAIPVPAVPAPVPHVAYPMPTASPQQGWHSAAAVHIYVPSHGIPYQVPAPLEQKTVEAPVQPVSAPVPVASPPAPVMVPPVQPPPLTKNFGADPYREAL